MLVHRLEDTQPEGAVWRYKSDLANCYSQKARFASIIKNALLQNNPPEVR